VLVRNGWMGWCHGWVDVWMGVMDGWMCVCDGWMDGWTGVQRVTDELVCEGCAVGSASGKPCIPNWLLNPYGIG